MGASSTPSTPPRVLRIETMPLDLGELAVVIELDRAPSAAWAKALDKALGQEEGLEDATARFDGRVAYLVGLEPGLRGVVQRVNRALTSVQGRAGADRRMAQASRADAPQVVHA